MRFKTGSLSHVSLSQTLQGTPAKDAHPSTDGGAKGAGGGKKTGAESKGEEGAKGKTPPEDWMSTNPSPVAAWKIPDGKDFLECLLQKGLVEAQRRLLAKVQFTQAPDRGEMAAHLPDGRRM